MVHPDYQYTPLLIPAMAALIGSGLYHCVLGSRILGNYALKGGMPLWKYVSNRVLTLVENLLIGAKLSEYHTGYRAFSRHLLELLPLTENSDDFVFDNQMLAQIAWYGLYHRRGQLPHEVLPRSVLHQLSSQRQIRLWLPGDRHVVSTGEAGPSHAFPNRSSALNRWGARTAAE
jgi:hypothetical protein